MCPGKLLCAEVELQWLWFVSMAKVHKELCDESFNRWGRERVGGGVRGERKGCIYLDLCYYGGDHAQCSRLPHRVLGV